MLQSLPCELHVGFAQQRIELRGLQLDRPVLIGTDVVHVKLLRLPGLQPFANLLREARGIGGSAKRLTRQNSRGLMMAVTVARVALKASADHIRTEGANHPHHVAQRDIVTAPLLERLFWSLGETEIGDPREALLDSVVAVGRQQLQRADDAELIQQIAADFVLPALAAIERELQHARAVPARLQREHAAVFVVGMSNGVHQPRRGVQSAQHHLQSGGTGVDGERLVSTQGDGSCAKAAAHRSVSSRQNRATTPERSSGRAVRFGRTIVCQKQIRSSLQSTQTGERARDAAPLEEFAGTTRKTHAHSTTSSRPTRMAASRDVRFL